MPKHIRADYFITLLQFQFMKNYLILVMLLIGITQVTFGQIDSVGVDSIVAPHLTLVRKYSSKPRFAGADFQIKRKYDINIGERVSSEIDFETQQTYYFGLPLLINKKGFTVSSSFIYSSLSQSHNTTINTENQVISDNLNYQTLLFRFKCF